jgi:hypothetical protein
VGFVSRIEMTGTVNRYLASLSNSHASDALKIYQMQRVELSFRLFVNLDSTSLSLIKEADMATVMLMEWPGVTEDQYKQVMRTLDLDK